MSCISVHIHPFPSGTTKEYIMANPIKKTVKRVVAKTVKKPAAKTVVVAKAAKAAKAAK